MRGNPSHLRLAPLTGAANPTAKLNGAQVAAIRLLNRRRVQGGRFAVTQAPLGLIVNARIWQGQFGDAVR